MPTTPEAAILCGGFGTRLAGLQFGLPKPMLPVGGQPLLAGLVAALARQGVARIVLCTGQGREPIRAFFAARDCGAEVLFSEETEPLGTAGALRLALPLLRTDPLLALNGDSWAPFDLSALVARQTETSADIALVAARADDRGDAGSLLLDERGRVRAFAEKRTVPSARLHSAGIYLMRRRVIEAIPAGRAVSLEREILPLYLDGRMAALTVSGPVVDIGTPERLAEAQAAAAQGRGPFPREG
ncbi:MAG: sugar phosphate nucleotidyltransferase [Terriglobales bacterium]